MDVRTNIKPHWDSHLRATGLPYAYAPDVSACREIFKKTPFVAGLHPVSRDVVKDIAEIDIIPLLTTRLPDRDVPQGLAVAGRLMMEKSTAVTLTFPQRVQRFADRRIAVSVGLVGGIETKTVNAAFTLSPNDARHSNGNLTARRWDRRTSDVAVRATKSRFDVSMSSDEPDQFANAGACLPGGDLENHRYVDV
jgi:hypothetical protein